MLKQGYFIQYVLEQVRQNYARSQKSLSKSIQEETDPKGTTEFISSEVDSGLFY